MKRNSHWLIALLVAGCSLGWCPPAPVWAQLNEPTLELFHNIIPSLDEELATKFRQAIDADRTWIEFTTDEFIRFRDNSANPFEGLHQLDPTKQSGKIRLEFKVPSPRDRIPIARERQHRSTLAVFDSSTAPLGPSTAKVICDGKWVALGTAIRANGLLLTKASELTNAEAMVCELIRDGQRVAVPAKLIRINESHDLALLKIDDVELQPVIFDRAPVEPGCFVATVDESGQPIMMGVVSTTTRCLTRVNQAYLGVKPVNAPSGVELIGVTEGGSAEQAGLQAGDVITRLDNQAIQNVTDLVNAVRLQRPGASITIEYIRDGQTQQVQTELHGRNLNAKRLAAKQIIDAGAIISARHDDFPLVFQHDTPLMPEHCGGPLVSLDGRVLGINIARAGRVSSLAINGPQVQLAIDQLLRENVASRE